MTGLLETIGQKAEASFGKPVCSDNYDEWVDHWIKTGYQWAEELYKQELILTGSSVKRLTDEAARHEKSRKEPKITYLRHFGLGHFNANFVEYKLGYNTRCIWFVPGTWIEQ